MEQSLNIHTQANASSKKKVFVGLSGGVDSSVSAALLQEEGYEVIGVFIKVWQADFLPCTWREERREAMRAAAHLGIPFLTLDLEKEYKDGVVDYMIGEYERGRVPNPDVMCNKHVKFGAFLDFAKKNGAEFIATGHYARIKPTPKVTFGVNDVQRSPLEYRLLAGVDKEKDQSYFLWTLSQEQLAHTLFPVGHLQKSEVRALAHKFGLPNAEKKDSQGLCFMGPVDMAEFLKHYLKTAKGDVQNEDGQVIGQHEGALLYTIGQRHGFTTTKMIVDEAPYFVIAKDIKKNILVVAHRKPDEAKGACFRMTVFPHSFVAPQFRIGEEDTIMARIRYRGALYPVILTEDKSGENRLTVDFKENVEGISAGQSIVFYHDNECLGGGVIDTI
jgi:tRNA-specific 2-thiouridylase